MLIFVILTAITFGCSSGDDEVLDTEQEPIMLEREDIVQLLKDNYLENFRGPEDVSPVIYFDQSEQQYKTKNLACAIRNIGIYFLEDGNQSFVTEEIGPVSDKGLNVLVGIPATIYANEEAARLVSYIFSTNTVSL